MSRFMKMLVCVSCLCAAGVLSAAIYLFLQAPYFACEPDYILPDCAPDYSASLASDADKTVLNRMITEPMSTASSPSESSTAESKSLERTSTEFIKVTIETSSKTQPMPEFPSITSKYTDASTQSTDADASIKSTDPSSPTTTPSKNPDFPPNLSWPQMKSRAKPTPGFPASVPKSDAKPAIRKYWKWNKNRNRTRIPPKTLPQPASVASVTSPKDPRQKRKASPRTSTPNPPQAFTEDVDAHSPCYLAKAAQIQYFSTISTKKARFASILGFSAVIFQVLVNIVCAIAYWKRPRSFRSNWILLNLFLLYWTFFILVHTRPQDCYASFYWTSPPWLAFHSSLGLNFLFLTLLSLQVWYSSAAPKTPKNPGLILA